MTDGREFTLLKIATVLIGDQELGGRKIWQAEYIHPMHKMHATYTRTERGFGTTPDEAIARMYEKLEDAGELNDSRLPCESCGKGYRILSVAESHIPHDDKCPAMNDTGET
jgi:hypothetical protein